MTKKPIYVEIEMHADIDKVWRYTQEPQLHEQWDLRFTSITYNEKDAEDAPQTFTYTTKVMPGLNVSGWGVSKGTHEKQSGIKTSSLHFGTEQLISPIAEGKGYWKYIPHEKGVTFLTQYDYDVRFGLFGKVFDLLFKPVMGWATALSFDVLKRWIEVGERPATLYRRFFSYYFICIAMFIIWVYQGLVPKVLLTHPQEVEMLKNLSGLTDNIAIQTVWWIGLIEIIFGLVWLLPFRKKMLFAFQFVLFPLLTVSALVANIETATAPFNVITFNFALWILSLIGYMLADHIPTATSCKRKRVK